MLNFRCSGRQTDMPFLRAREEIQYEVDLTSFVGRLLDRLLTSDVGEVSSVGMSKVILGRSFHKLWLIDKHKYWGRDQ